MNKFWKYALFELIAVVLLHFYQVGLLLRGGGGEGWFFDPALILRSFAIIFCSLTPLLVVIALASRYHDDKEHGLYYKLPLIAIATTMSTLIITWVLILATTILNLFVGSQGIMEGLAYYLLVVNLWGYLPFIIIVSIIIAAITQKSYTSSAISQFYAVLPKIARICLIVILVLIIIYVVRIYFSL